MSNCKSQTQRWAQAENLKSRLPMFPVSDQLLCGLCVWGFGTAFSFRSSFPPRIRRGLALTPHVPLHSSYTSWTGLAPDFSQLHCAFQKSNTLCVSAPLSLITLLPFRRWLCISSIGTTCTCLWLHIFVLCVPVFLFPCPVLERA